MSKGLSYFKELASKAKTTANSEEALKIKNKLIKIGIILMVIGGLGLLISFIGPVIIMALKIFFVMDGAEPSISGFFGSFIGSAILTALNVPFLICFGIGCYSLILGLGIVVVKATVNFADPNKYCPHCGDVIYEDELYCSKCGKPLLVNKICKNCNTENDIDSNFCKSCGNKLC